MAPVASLVAGPVTMATSGRLSHRYSFPFTRCAILKPWVAFIVVWPLFPVEQADLSSPGTREMLCFYTCHFSIPLGSVSAAAPPGRLLSSLAFSPVLPPGWWLSGPGVERSQENSRRDLGEGQHCGECAVTRSPAIAALGSCTHSQPHALPLDPHSCPLHMTSRERDCQHQSTLAGY